MAERNSKKLILYQDRKSKTIFIHPTKINSIGDFVTKSKEFSKAFGSGTTNEELGKNVREYFKICD